MSDKTTNPWPIVNLVLTWLWRVAALVLLVLLYDLVRHEFYDIRPPILHP